MGVYVALFCVGGDRWIIIFGERWVGGKTFLVGGGGWG